MITKRHTYGLIYKISRSLFVFLAFVSIVLGFLFTAGFIASLIKGDEFDSSSIMTIFGNIFGVVVWAPIFYLFFAYLMTDISVDNDAMNVQFLWKNYQIRWDEVIEIKPLRPFGLFTNKNSKVIVVNTKLTFVHHLYGLFYTGKYQPAILVHRKISDYELLIRNISTQAKTKSEKSVSD